MFFEILIATIIGVIAGIVTGLIPGIHINLLSLLLVSISPLLLKHTNVLALSCFIIGMSITHTFLDAIPSIFLGAPDASQVLLVLPGHKLLLEGKGFEAVKLTVIGSLLCLIFAVMLVPILIPLVKIIYPILKDYIGYILLVIILFMLFKDKSYLKNIFVFLLSGSLGIIVLNSTIENPLFPMLSGLFGTSMLFTSLLQKVQIPKQEITETIKVPKKELISAISGGTIAGTLTSFFPGLGPSQGAVLATQLLRKISDYGFMILVGGLNTVNFVLSLITLLVLDKARNGAVIAIKELIQINPKVLIIFLGSALIAGGIATILALRITRIFSKLFDYLEYEDIVHYVIILIACLVFYFSGIIGLIILVTSTCVGIVTAELKVAKNHAMGCLLLPVLIFFLT